MALRVAAPGRHLPLSAGGGILHVAVLCDAYYELQTCKRSERIPQPRKVDAISPSLLERTHGLWH